MHIASPQPDGASEYTRELFRECFKVVVTGLFITFLIAQSANANTPTIRLFPTTVV